jgi:hypothetical protein
LKILRQMCRFQKTKFCATWNIQCRSIMSHIHPPKALFIQIFMILHQCHCISAIYLSKLFFKMTTFTVCKVNLDILLGIQRACERRDKWQDFDTSLRSNFPWPLPGRSREGKLVLLQYQPILFYCWGVNRECVDRRVRIVYRGLGRAFVVHKTGTLKTITFSRHLVYVC